MASMSHKATCLSCAKQRASRDMKAHLEWPVSAFCGRKPLERPVWVQQRTGGGGREELPGAPSTKNHPWCIPLGSTCSGDGEESNREMSNVCWFYSGYCVKNVELVCKRMNVSHCHSFCQRCLSPSHFTFLLSVLLSVPCYMTKTPCVALFLYRNIHSVGVDIVKGSACVFAKLNLYIQFLDLNFRGCW